VPSRNRVADPTSPPVAIDTFITLRQKPQRNLRRIAEQRVADKIPTLIFNVDDRATVRIDCHDIAAVDPQVSLPDPIRAFFINSRRIHR
jgi:hypothetical protein